MKLRILEANIKGTVYNLDYGVGFNALRFRIVYSPGQSRLGIGSIKKNSRKTVEWMRANVLVGGEDTAEPTKRPSKIDKAKMELSCEPKFRLIIRIEVLL